MSRLVAILLAISVAALPLRAMPTGPCPCATAAGQTAGDDASHDCCDIQRSTESPGHERPDDRGCQDECPRLCCTTVKVPATPDRLEIPRLAPPGVDRVRLVASGERTFPHLREMKRPPRHASTV